VSKSTAPTLSGPQLVVRLYVALVGVGAAAGAAVASTIDGLRAPRLLFAIELPPTVAGFVVFGAVTVAVVLGVPLTAVWLGSRLRGW
jgi:uncharacterized ferredoxin-like protein